MFLCFYRNDVFFSLAAEMHLFSSLGRGHVPWSVIVRYCQLAHLLMQTATEKYCLIWTLIHYFPSTHALYI